MAHLARARGEYIDKLFQWRMRKLDLARRTAIAEDRVEFLEKKWRKVSNKAVIFIPFLITYTFQAIREGRTTNTQETWMRATRAAVTRALTYIQEDIHDYDHREAEREQLIRQYKRMKAIWKSRSMA